MKVFWSWQSDTPGKTGRHFVRDCLQAAVDRLKVERSEASELEAAAREAIELDQDRKGVKGSPGLADTIYAKIREAAVVVCDVTPVAVLVAGDGRVKKLTNPNVAIELGYAQGTRGDDRVLMVLNLAYGRHEELAFDLRHKTGILTFTLADDAEGAAIKAEARKFTTLLVDALRPYAEEPAAVPEQPAPFEAMPATTDAARWWQLGDVLGHRPSDGRDIVGPDTPLIYLRLMPTCAVPQTAAADVHEALRHFSTLYGGGHVGRNRWGSVLLSYDGRRDGDLVFWGATQLFQSGEVWAIDAYHLREEPGRGPGFPYVPIGAVENSVHRATRHIASAMADHLGTPLPIALEFGMAPAEGFRIPLANHNWSDKCFDQSIQLRAEIGMLDDVAIDVCLHQLFGGFWDRFGERRPPDRPLGGGG